MIKYYDIIIELKEDSKRIEKIWILQQELYIFMEQFSNYIVTLNGVVINGIDDCSVFQIIEKNFKEYRDWEYIVWVEAKDQNWDDCIEELEFDSLKESKVDITNELLTKYKIRAWYYGRIWRVVLDERKLYVDNKLISKLEEGRKPIELISLILEIPYKEKFTYDELKDIYNISQINFQELTRSDLNETSVREIIWKKIKASKDIANIEFIKISSEFISLWKEKES